ncbi:hypothetical protein SESBI_50986 [Sesbania bispinosa]|nr:hypothetical protein SESBI_50986 [Sesbania bispinosa]
MSWKEKCANFTTLKPLSDDDDAMELSAHAVLRKCEVEVYVEHSVRVTEKVHEDPLLLPALGNVAGDATDPETVEKVQEAMGERDLGLDDGFGVGEVGQAEAALNEQVERMKENIVSNENDGLPEANLRPEVHKKKKLSPKRRASTGVGHPVEVPNETMNIPEDVAGGEGQPEVFVPADVVAMHDIEDGYLSDVLDSGVDEYGLDDNGKPRKQASNSNMMFNGSEATSEPDPAGKQWRKAHMRMLQMMMEKL